MPHALINELGCGVWHGGLVKIRADICLNPGDNRYDDPRFYQPDWESNEAQAGYPGLVDKDGSPLDPEQYKAWVDKLPHIWLPERHFHTHFLRFEPDVSQEQVEQAIKHHIPNFYAAWCEEYDKLPGGMRRGWDVATRWKAIGRPRRYDLEMNPTELEARRSECQSKLGLILKANLSVQSSKKGETFPATEIDVGSEAKVRSSSTNSAYTWFDINNLANGDGALDTAEIYTYTSSNATFCYVTTFFNVSGTTYESHDREDVGVVTSGDKRTFTNLDIDVAEDDAIGSYSDAKIFLDTSGYGGAARSVALGDYTFPETQAAYYLSYYTDDAFSLYCTGETAGAERRIFITHQ
jgi:hypothetical protein